MANELILLNTLIDEWRKTAPMGLDEHRYPELFVAEQILKDYDLATSDVLEGCVGGPDDGGVDGFFILVNDELVDEDTDFSEIKREPRLRLVVIQDKSGESFGETALTNLNATLKHLLDLSVSEADLRTYYRDSLVNRCLVFRTALSGLMARHVVTTVEIYYSTRGDTQNINPKVLGRARDLEQLVSELIPGSAVSVRFEGASELLSRTNKIPTYTLTLRFKEGPLSDGQSYIMLVSLPAYFDFITDDSGTLRKYLFEWNVRDYQGDVEVNKDIRRTLEDENAPQFWWMNNGVTIIASQATSAGKEMAISDVQIVNGLQTSVEIFEHLRANEGDDAKALVCRVIVTDDKEVRDKVIKATNFQTSVSAASLKATDEVQRSIEHFLYANKWYYDRRKNYYKNQSRPADRIVTIPNLAQAVMAMGLTRPDFARARPTTVIKNEDDYGRVFDSDVDLRVYLWAAQTMREVEQFLRNTDSPGDSDEKREFKFHLTTWLIARWVGKRLESPKDLIELLGKEVTESELTDAMKELVELLHAYKDFGITPLDRIAKSRDFVRYLYKSRFGIDS